jgi:hypothetical protein
MSDLAKLVIKRFPEKRDMQLVCLRIAAKFKCSHCHAPKQAKLLAVQSDDWDRLLCEECYGKLLSKPPPEPPPPPEDNDEDSELDE